MQDSKEIPGFPDYIVTRDGQVVNVTRGWPLKPSFNQHGIAHVGLYNDGKLTRRSVATLVVDAFLEPDKNVNYNTPIHLDGDKKNNSAENLVLRPRWFALEYHRQFGPEVSREWRELPIEIVKTGETFERCIDCCSKYGLLVRDVVLSAFDGHRIVPIIWSRVRIADYLDT